MTALSPRENPFFSGHESAERAICDALSGGRLHHAWLISGPEGVGKATLAYRFARRLLAGGSATLQMPPTDPVFRRVAQATHADLLTVEREWDDKKKRLKKNIAAETAREIPGFLHLTAAEGGWRVVIVDGAEDMNAQSANALLKVLEEPPARAVLMLVAATPARLLPTIRSRCRSLALAPLSHAGTQQILGAYLPDMDPADRAALSVLANGSPGRALALAEQGGLAIAAMVDEVMQAAPKFPLSRGYDMADKLRDEAAFDMFFALLQQAIARRVSDRVRGKESGIDVDRWGGIWSRVGQIHHDANQHNLEKKQAVMAALGLLAQG